MAKSRKPQPDLLDSFAQAPLDRVLQLVLWTQRHTREEMTVLVTEEDVRAYDACMEYQQLKPELLVYRPEGRPATAAIPAAGSRRAVPARPAEPPRPYVIVGVVEQGKRNAIKPIESDEQHYRIGELNRQVQVVKRNIPDYVAALRRAAASGDFSAGTMESIAQALELWGRT